MSALLERLFPPVPSGWYRFLRLNLVLALGLFFVVQAGMRWVESVLRPPVAVQHAPLPDRARGTASEAQSTAQPDWNTQNIIERNIFGGSATEPITQAEEDAVELDDIPLAENLKHYVLLGTIIGSDGTKLAIIENRKKNAQQLMREGDALEEATIKRILRNNVIINDGTEDAALSIDYKIRSRIQNQTTESAGPEGGAQAQRTIGVDRQTISEKIANIPQLMQNVRIQPYLQNGEAVGMQVSRIKDGSLFDSLQLRNGDVLLGTESTPLNSPQQFMELSQSLQSRDAVNLRIRRQGEEIRLRYELR